MILVYFFIAAAMLAHAALHFITGRRDRRRTPYRQMSALFVLFSISFALSGLEKATHKVFLIEGFFDVLIGILLVILFVEASLEAIKRHEGTDKE